MMKAMKILVNPQLTYKMVLSTDGSGKGASLVAAVADKMKTDLSS